MDCHIAGVLHYPLKFAQTQVRWVSDAASLLSFCLQSFISIFSNESSLHISGQSIGASASASVLPMNIQGWFPLGLAGLILQFKGRSRVFSSTTIWKYQFVGTQPSLWSKSHICTWLLGKTIASTTETFVSKVLFLLFNTLSRFDIVFLPRSKCLLISWLQSPSEVILEPRKIKSATVSPSTCHEVMGPDAMILVFWQGCDLWRGVCQWDAANETQLET